MSEAVRSIDVNVPIEHMYKVITDFEHLPEFISGVLGIVVESRKDEVYRVRYRIRMIKEIEYTIELHGSPPRRLDWTFIRGDMMKENRGAWELESAGPNRTRVTYRIDLQLSAFVPNSITRQLAELSLPKMLEEFKARAEATV